MPNKNDDGYSNNGYSNNGYSNDGYSNNGGNGNRHQNQNHQHQNNPPRNGIRNSRNTSNSEEMDTFNEGFSKNIVNKVDDEKISKIKVHNYTDKYDSENENLKELAQNAFFTEDDSDNLNKEKTTKADKSFLRNIVLMLCVVGLSVSVILLSFSLRAAKDELNLANSELTDLLDSQKDAERKLAEEALQSENEALKAELDSLKDPDDDSINDNSIINNEASNNNNNNAISTENSTVATTQAPTTSASSSNTLGGTSYTVQAGDSSIWDISKKLYGNGAYFQKILDANNMKDGDILKEGQVLVIPEL
ncbi:MAG: LysM peptidoglycan-binding domain-containing protein [bacterium]